MTRFASLALLGMALLPVSAVAEPAIAWHACAANLVGLGADALGARLQCGVLSAPLDHLVDDGRRIDVGVVRVRALRQTQRQGAIFFNTGGPGGNPASLLRWIAANWSNATPGEPGGADKRLLAERYDLVAVIPRGLRGGWEYRCITGKPPRFEFLSTRIDDANWNLAIEEAEDVVAACTFPVQAPYINTEQHVHDMDMVRRLLGDTQLQFYGISYGGKVGAWYAAMYPAHTGRMLLDSSMTFTHDFRTALDAMLNARRDAFLENVLEPLRKAPALYGLGTDPLLITGAVENLPRKARAAWLHVLDTPVRLAAALHVAGWIEIDGVSRRAEFNVRLRDTTFSPVRVTADAIRRAAKQMVELYLAPPLTGTHFADGQDGDSVRTAVACNDSIWYYDDLQLRGMAARNAAAYLTNNGEEIFEQMVCTRWGRRGSRQPNLDILKEVSPFLLVQSEKDLVTPLSGAREAMRRFDNARLLLVRGASLHGLFNFTTSPCIEGTAAHYLLTGEVSVDDQRTVTCEGIFDNPISALPSSTSPAPTRPASEPTHPPVHDET